MTSCISIVATVKRRRIVWWAPTAALVIQAVLGSGCGGIQGSHSVSPASFFLPGLIQNDEAPPPDPKGDHPAAVSGPREKKPLPS